MDTKPEPIPVIKQLIQIAGNQQKLARALGCTQSAVSQWLNGQCRIGPKWALEAERLYGVSRHDLRPDIYPRERMTDTGGTRRTQAVDRLIYPLFPAVPAMTGGVTR